MRRGGRVERRGYGFRSLGECKGLVRVVVHNERHMRIGVAQVVEGDLVSGVEGRRVDHAPVRPGRLGQVFTPMAVASVLSGMFEVPSGRVRILDPGAGVGSLTAAVVERAVAEKWRASLDVTAVEVDSGLLGPLEATLEECRRELPSLTSRVAYADFLEWGCGHLDDTLWNCDPEQFDLAILNPPYAKLGARSREAAVLARVGIKARNLYAAFVTLSLRLLRPGGQLVAIIPRSFCNGPYFRAFRKELLESAALRGVHVFEARDQAFRDAGVLQENVIVHLVKERTQREVLIQSSWGDGREPVSTRSVPFADVVHPSDPHRFLRLVTSNAERDLANRMYSLSGDLESLTVSVSTGRVVDFRIRPYLRSEPGEGTVPLIYPLHMRDGRVQWPAPKSRKANALLLNGATRRLVLPAGNYVLVKRFSSKEQHRRVVASVLSANDLPGESVGIENHVNVYHREGGSLPIDLAWGIATYLNSTIVDRFFRQFNGHTQVNATDLRSLRYPTIDQLTTLGEHTVGMNYVQTEIDASVARHVQELANI